MRDREPWGPFGRDILVAGLLFACFSLLYTHSITIHARNLLRPNFLFDADILAVVTALTRGVPINAARHPLFELLLGDLGSTLAGLAGDPWRGAVLVCAGAGALSVALAHRVLLRITGDRVDALLFALLFGLSSSVWLLSSIPETFPINNLLIVLAFTLQDRRYALPRGHPVRFAGYVLYSVICLGVTQTNAFYSLLGYLRNLRDSALRARERLGSLALYGSLVTLLFCGLYSLQTARAPIEIPSIGSALDPIGMLEADAHFFQVDRAWSLRELGSEARSFLADNIAAPAPEIAVLRTTRGPQQLIQMRGTGPLYWAASATLALLVAVLLGTARPLRRVLEDRHVHLALGFIAFNFALHYFYRGNGQRLLFSIHVTFAVIVLASRVFALSRARRKRTLLGVAVALCLANNLAFVARTNQLLELRCLRALPDAARICLEWEPQPPLTPPRP